KLQLCSVFCFRSWVDADVRFGDVACVGIEEDACAPSHLTGVEGFVLRSRRDRQQVDAIARVGRTDRSKRRPRDDKIYVRKTGPASKRAAHGTDDVAIGFDVRTGASKEFDSEIWIVFLGQRILRTVCAAGSNSNESRISSRSRVPRDRNNATLAIIAAGNCI